MTATTTQTQITAQNVIHLFPEVENHLANSHRASIDEHDLQGYDEEQIRLMEEGIGPCTHYSSRHVLTMLQCVSL